jgi:non-specific serine/threonine protein kinase/serine/threonine-protein kinase
MKAELTEESPAVVQSHAALRSLPESSLAKLRRRLRGDLDTIVLQAIRKEPQRRYASVEKLSEDIRRHLEGLPVTARRDSWNYRAGKFAIRHKLGVAASALILIVVLGGVAATVREARIAAANQRSAEERFNDVRKLAGSLMYEIHDSIAGLPGATPARKLIVQRSLEYLDGLSREAAGDVSLQRELANAYERIGLVQGDPTGSNLGDIAGALESFSKALKIRERVNSTPSSEHLADGVALAASYREMCAIHARYLSKIGAALDYCGKALSTSGALFAADPANRRVQTELARDYEAHGTVYGQNSTSGNAGDSYAALENHRRALDLVVELAAADPANLDLTSWRGSLGLLTADDLFETGKVSQAIPLYREATSTFEDLIKQSHNPSYEDSLNLAYQRMGDMLLVAGHFEQSLPYYKKQLELSVALVTSDPKNMAFRTNLIAAHATYGHALFRAGHLPEALASFRIGLAQVAESKQTDTRAGGVEATTKLWMAGAFEKQHDWQNALHNYLQVEEYYARICQSEPKDLEDCLGLAGTQDRIGRIRMQRGNPEGALAEYKQAITISEPLSSGVKPNLEAIYTLVNLYFGMGDVYASLAQQSPASRKSLAIQRESCGWYKKSYTAYQRIPEWLPITPNEFDSRNPKEIEDHLSQCRVRSLAGLAGEEIDLAGESINP